jgi:tetratricopeptide (TPR) repeat protein
VEVERSTKCTGGPVHFHRVIGGKHDLRNQVPNIGQAFVDFFRGLSTPAAAPAAPPPTALLGNEQPLCFSGAVGDINVAACSRLIASGTLRGGDVSRTHLQRAILLARRGDDFDHVIADASELIRLDPGDVHAYALRGGSYQHKGDAARARTDIEKVLQLGPRTSLSYNALSNYYNMTGAYDRGLAMANESLRSSPGNAYGRKNRADSLEGQGQLAEALAEFRAVLVFDPQRQERLGRESAAAIQRIEQKLGKPR